MVTKRERERRNGREGKKKGKGGKKREIEREREAWWDSSKLNDGERSNGTPSELPLLSLSVTHGPRRGCATIIYDAFFHYAFRSFSAFLPPRFSPSLSGFRAAATGPTHEPRLNGVASADGRFFHERRSIVSRFVNFTNEREIGDRGEARRIRRTEEEKRGKKKREKEKRERERVGGGGGENGSNRANIMGDLNTTKRDEAS